MKHTVEYMENGSLRTATVDVNEAEAIQAAIDYLGAEPVDEDTWEYQESPGGTVHRVDWDDLVRAGAAILSGVPEWYSLWCRW